MRYVFVTIIVFLLGLGLFFYGALGFKLWENLNPGKIGKASVAGVAVTPRPTGTLRGNMRPFFGTIVGVKDGKFEVKNTDGSKAKVMISDSITVSGGKKQDLVVGKRVSGVGKVDSKGIISATAIQINPRSLSTKVEK